MRSPWLALLLLATCAIPAAADLVPGDYVGLSLIHDGRTRTYDVHVPAAYDGATALPLVVDIHGYSSNASQQRGFSGLLALSNIYGFLLAWPQGVSASWNAGSVCCDPARADGVDDVGALRAIVDHIDAQANVDRDRVYATGLSNGGAMSHRLACEAGDTFAAVVSVAAPLFIEPYDACQPVRPMPVMHFAGLTDTVVPYDGGQSPTFPWLVVPASPASYGHWLGVDGCEVVPDVVEPLGNGASCAIHTSCQGGAEVRFCAINGQGESFLGHILYYNTDGVNVAQRTWDFLSRFTLPGATSSTTTTSNSTSTTTSTTTTSTLGPLLCGTVPAGGCTTADSAFVLVDERRLGKEKLKVRMTKFATDVAPGAFGDPVAGTTSVAFCLYGGDDSLVSALVVDRAGATCGAKPCWTGNTAKGWRFADKPGSSTGLQKVILKPGLAGHGKVLASGANSAPAQVGLPQGIAAALAGDASATVQLRTSDGGCFTGAMTRVETATSALFKASRR